MFVRLMVYDRISTSFLFFLSRSAALMFFLERLDNYLASNIEFFLLVEVASISQTFMFLDSLYFFLMELNYR